MMNWATSEADKMKTKTSTSPSSSITSCPLAQDLSNNNKTSSPGAGHVFIKKHKPIPPPLDLSIGATNLSLNNNNINNNLTGSANISHFSPTYNLPPPHLSPWASSPHTGLSPFLKSPNFSISGGGSSADDKQQDKRLPPRKRFSSSYTPSPTIMNQEDLPLIKSEHHDHLNGMSDGESGSSSNSNGIVIGSAFQYSSAPPPTTSTLASMTSNASTSTYSRGISSYSPFSSLNTPSPFYTPNEPSPKFMNSPIFSYAPEMYQGPYTPTRGLYAPTSPFPPHLSFAGVTSTSSNNTTTTTTTPGGPMSSGSGSSGTSGGSNSNSSCYNMIPSTLLSPAPSQASTNSLSYEDLQDQKPACVSPVWNIFMAGTKVRFHSANLISPTEWYTVDELAHEAANNVGFKGDYAPHGLAIKKLVVTSATKERVQITFSPMEPDRNQNQQPDIEVDCEPSHPFYVDKKGWCAVKPEVFSELFASTCLPLICGDICSNPANRSHQQQPTSQQAATSNSSVVNPGTTHGHLGNSLMHHQQQQILHHQQAFHVSHGSSVYGGILGGTPALFNGNHVGSPGSWELNGNLSQNVGVVTSMKDIDVKPDISMQGPLKLSGHVAMHGNHPQGGYATVNGKKFAVPAATSNKKTKGKDVGANEDKATDKEKGRRPSNAFLLFAKDKRQELIQQYPGKDNRSISVMLGQIWRSLDATEKEKYVSSAKDKAEEQKRIHPDCWKRKRSQPKGSNASKKGNYGSNSNVAIGAAGPKNGYLPHMSNGNGLKNGYIETPAR